MLGVYILVASVIACLIVCSLVVLRRVRDDKTVVYGLLTIALLVLSVANSMSLDVTGDQLFYVRWVMASTTVALYLIYVLILTLKKHPDQRPFYASALFYLTLIVFGMDFTDFLFAEVISGNPPKPVPGPGVVLFFGHFGLMMGLAIKRLISDIFGTRSLKERRQYIPLIVGIVPIIILAPLTSFILPNFGFPQLVVLTPLYAFIFVAAVGYAIVRHGLFDVRRVVIRTIAYVLSLITLAAAYYTVAYILSITLLYNDPKASVGVSPLNIFLALLLAFIFQPIKQFFDRITNNIFFRDQYNSEDFYARLSETLTSTTELRGLLQRAAKEIGSTLKANQAFFYTQYNHVHHISAGTHGHSLLPVADGKMLADYVQLVSGKDALVTELLEGDNPIRRLLVSHKIALLLPLVKHGNMLGFLALGDHQGRGYTERDIKVLETITDELMIAIQNAISTQEVKDINAHLEQRIKTATQELKATNAHLRRLDAAKDEFVSMASHQLRTPLTSIKGYLSMVLEGDAGKITGDQRKLIGEAFDSSERMVRLIHDFLNVSRLQNGKFAIEYTTYDIAGLINEEIRTLQSTAEKRNIKIKTDVIDHLNLEMDETKMRQVIMNFIDNALYYSKENTTVKVELKKDDDVLVFRVTDTGIGVPLSERERLFTKFYRASNARVHRPDGTGVGLYLAKKVIAGHGGSVLYEPHDKGGSTFGFKLPLTNK